MKNKKGFTLIEVISVLIILGLLASIVITQYATTIRDSRKRLNEEQKSRMVEVAKDISLNNKKCLEIAKDNPSLGVKITLDQMYKNGYIANSEVKDLEENVILNSCVLIKWDTVYSKFDYEYSTDCNSAKTCAIAAESEKVIVSSFYLGEGNTNYTNSRNVNYYMNYSSSIYAEYCVTLENEANCNWKKLDNNASIASGPLTLTGIENVAHLYIRNANKNVISSIDDTIVFDNEEPTCVWKNPSRPYISSDYSTELVLSCNDIAGIKNTELLASSLTYDENLVSVSNATISTVGTTKEFKFNVYGQSGNGTVKITLKPNVLSDNSGNILTSSKTSDNIYIDNVKPNGEVTIGDSNSQYTNTENVVLHFSNVSSDVDKFCVSNYETGNCSFMNYTSTYPWTLSTSDGQKTIYVSFADKAGNVTKKTVTIYLDKVAPNCLVTTKASSHQSAYNLKNGSYVDYLVNCTDRNSVPNNVINNSMITTSVADKVETSIVSSSSEGTVVRVKAKTGDGRVKVYLSQGMIFDVAGNGNRLTEIANILVDNTIPYNNKISLNFNSTITHLRLAIVDLDSDVKAENGYYCLRLVDNVSSCGDLDWQEFSISPTIQLGSTEGTYTVYAYFKDLAGNISTTAVSDSIKYSPSAVSCVLMEEANSFNIATTATNLASEPYSIDGTNWTNSNVVPKISGIKYYRAYIKDQNGDTNYCEIITN